MKETLHTLLLASAALLVGVWWVLSLDALTVGAGAVLAVTGLLAGVLGGALALSGGIAIALCDGLDRWRGWTRGRTLGCLAPIGLAALLAPAHTALTVHAVGALLMAGYTLVASAAIYLNLLKVWHGERRWLAGLLALGAAMASVALHWINSRYFAGLYLPLHHALTAVSVLLAAGAAAVLLRGHLRLQGVAIGAILIGAALSAGRVERPGWQAAVFLHGTELKHGLDVLAQRYDADDDGYAGGWIGADCNDADAEVHPLRFEIPQNGKDDNCRLGDAPRNAPLLSRAAPRDPAVAAWRTAHPDVDVVLLFIDTLRADHLTPEHTPNLWALAQRGVVFEQARTTAPRTPHAWTSLITGRYNGRNLRCRKALRPPSDNSLVPRLKAKGLRTLGRLIGTDFKRRRLDRGFETIRLDGHVSRSTGASVTRDSLRLIGKAPERFFLAAHYADAHAPYKAPAPFAVDGDLRDRYAAEVRYVDHEIGRLIEGLKARGRWQNTLIVALSDHGENLGERGEAGGHHGVSVYDEVLHVPLIFAGPGIAPRRVRAPVSIVDVAPTLLDLVGARPLRSADGRSLASTLLGGSLPPAATISEFYDFNHRLRALVDGRYKLVDDPQHGVSQLFDLRTDPQELTDLTASHPAEAARLRAQLDAWVEHRIDRRTRPPKRCAQR